MNYREIPEAAVEVQPGLWWHYHPFTFNGNVIPYGELYATEGYCFYDLMVPENFDEDGNLKPAGELLYAIYSTCVCATVDEVNAMYFSVPYQPGYEVVNVPVNPPVTE